MKKLFLLAALCVAAAFSSCSKHDNVEPQPLAIAFAEGNSLEFDAGETKTVHYTITGGSDKTVVMAELQNPDNDNAYAFYITQTSATEGTIKITAKVPSTDNRVIVTVSDGSQTIMAAIDVTIKLKASFDGKTVEVKTAGTLAKLLADYDKTTITELTVIGNLNGEDISTLKNLPNLAILDLEHVNLEESPSLSFFKNTSLTSVKLPLTLKTIRGYAFYNCSSLTSVTIPDSVTEIGDYAFYNCFSLTSITIPDSVMEIGNSAFYECSSLTSITIGNSVTTIGSWAFYGCSSLTSITIPDGVTSIGERTFYGCRSLTSITIPASVTTIEGYAFVDCNSLTGVYITDIAKWCAIEFAGIATNPLFDAHNLYLNGELVTELVIPDSVTKIGNSAFFGCSSLTSVTIPNSVTSIEGSAFSSCSSLTSVTIGNGVTSIGGCAFYNCRSLTSITIGNSVTEIGSEAFSGCSSLTSISIPDSVTSIGNYAFRSCSSLRSVYCKAQTPPTIESLTFNNVAASIPLYVPTGCADAYRAAQYWSKFTNINEMEF